LWTGLFFLFLGFDETLSIHERIHTDFFKFRGFALLDYSWVFALSGFILVALASLLLLILMEKHKETRASYICGFLVFIFVFVLELIGSGMYGSEAYLYIVGIEEFSELSGIMCFTNGALLSLSIQKNERAKTPTTKTTFS
jgi:hypothetical protein